MVRAVGLTLLSLLVLCAAPAAQAAPVSFTATLDGPSENPPNASPGTGFAEVTYDADLHTLRVEVSFSGLVGVTTAAHIHVSLSPPDNGIPATTVPTFAGFPLGVTSGAFDLTLDLENLTSFNPTFVTNNGGTVASAEAALADALFESRAYLNIHTSVFGGGEIRGFLQPVPEPASLVLLAGGLAGLWFLARRGGRRMPAARR